MKPKIGFFGTQPYEKEAFDEANANLGLTMDYIEKPFSMETIHLAKGCTAVCIFANDVVDKRIIDALISLGVGLIALRCAGHDQVDLKEAKGKIAIVNVPKYSPYAVAEYAVGLILCLNRKYHHAYDRTQKCNFSIAGLQGFDLHGKSVGLIGVGKIGMIVAQILKGFGMKVQAYDIDPTQVKKAQVPYVDLPTLYQESDIISLHAPLTHDNLHMLRKKAFSQMKQGIFIVNTGRGGLINTIDLLEALESGKVGGAALDVYEYEKEIFYKDLSHEGIHDPLLQRLLELPQVIITSHQAYFTKEAMDNIARSTLASVGEFVAKKPLTHELIASGWR